MYIDYISGPHTVQNRPTECADPLCGRRIGKGQQYWQADGRGQRAQKFCRRIEALRLWAAMQFDDLRLEDVANVFPLGDDSNFSDHVVVVRRQNSRLMARWCTAAGRRETDRVVINGRDVPYRDAEAHREVPIGDDGRISVVADGKNYEFNL